MDAAYRGPPPRCAGNLLDGMHTSHLAGSQSVQGRGCRLSAWRRGSRGLPERVRSQCVHAPGTSGGACWLQQVWLWRGQCPRASPIAHEDDRSAEASWSLSPRRRPPSTTTLSWQPLPGLPSRQRLFAFCAVAIRKVHTRKAQPAGGSPVGEGAVRIPCPPVRGRQRLRFRRVTRSGWRTDRRGVR